MSHWRGYLTVFMLLCSINTVYAVAQTKTIDIELATKQLNDINRQLSEQKINYSILYVASNTLHVLQSQADTCVTSSADTLRQIDEILKEIGVMPATALIQDNSYYHSLVGERERAAEQLAACGFVRFQSQKTLKKMNEELANLGVNDMLERTPSLWRKFDLTFFSQISIDPQIVYLYSGVGQLSPAQRIALPFVFCFGLIVAALGRLWFTNLLSKKEKKWFPFALIRVFKQYLPAVLPFAFLSIFLHLALKYVSRMSSSALLIDALFFYFLALAIVKIYATVIAVKSKWLNEQVVGMIVRRVHVLIFLIFLGTVVSIVFGREQPISPVIIDLITAIYITVLTLSFLWVSWIVFQSHFFKTKVSRLFVVLIKVLFWVVFTILIVFAWCGYEHLALFFIPNLIATLIVITIFFRGSFFLSHVYATLSEPHQRASIKLRLALGIKSEKKLIELFVIRIIFNIGLGLYTAFALLKIWDVPNYYIDVYITSMTSGIYIFGIKIIPVRVLRGCFMFCAILLLGRMLATYSARRHTLQEENDRQVAIATLITYVSFSIAILVGLLIAGVNLTGFALVAGALSVGIGFGLQNLANDFVSGLILLVNKPVRPGDHVVIDATEGYVKKIRILSTQVTTLEHADVMIPNSYLINKTISDYTFRDNKFWKIKSQFVLESAKDLELAKQLMLEIAAKNTHVVQKTPHQPVVLFEPTLFPSGFQFAVIDLWCIIRDVDMKHMVLSDLNFAIVDAFQKNDIKTKFS